MELQEWNMNPQDSDIPNPHQTEIGPIVPGNLSVSLSWSNAKPYPFVNFVAPDGQGAILGLRVGDVITGLNGRDVEDLDISDFTTLVRTQTMPYRLTIITAKLKRVFITPFNRARMRHLAMAVNGSTLNTIHGYGRYTLLLPHQHPSA